jgi:DNA-binding response OmpR family regulator
MRSSGYAQGQTTLEEVERVIGGAGTDQAGSEAQSPLVLLVDDDQVSRTLARKVLEKSAFRVEEAGSGLAALAQLEAGSEPALLVLDLDMPGMGGREVLARVPVATAGLPVLVLTGSGTEEMEAELMEEGVDDYIRKPLEPARFMARVRAALRRAAE